MQEMPGIKEILRPMDFPALYPGVEGRDLLQSFEEDLRLLTKELLALDGIASVGGEILVEFIQGGPRMRLIGELKVKHSHFSFDAYRAILELLEQGFQYRVQRGVFVAEGEV